VRLGVLKNRPHGRCASACAGEGRGCVSKVPESKVAQTIHRVTDVNVGECYQCGKCTGGCPMSRYMDLTPNQIMRLAQLTDADAERRLLTSGAIWRCIGCLTCAQRCPKKLDPAAVIDALREISYQRGLVAPGQKKILEFHKALLKMVEKTGRMSEAPLTALYKMKSRDFFSDVTMAPAMLARGKLRPPKIIHGRKDMHRIFKTCHEEALK
jgi:heterodisulfide reductase subunit C